METWDAGSLMICEPQVPRGASIGRDLRVEFNLIAGRSSSDSELALYIATTFNLKDKAGSLLWRNNPTACPGLV